MFIYTFRNEYEYLSCWEDQQDPYVEYQRFLNIGIDAYFTDFPGSLKRFFQSKKTDKKSSVTYHLWLWFWKTYLIHIFYLMENNLLDQAYSTY